MKNIYLFSLIIITLTVFYLISKNRNTQKENVISNALGSSDTLATDLSKQEKLVSYDKARQRSAASPQRDVIIESTINTINGGDFKDVLEDIFKDNGIPLNLINQVVDVYSNMDRQLLEVSRSRDLNFPEEVGDRSDAKKIERAEAKYREITNEITNKSKKEILAILKDEKVVRKITAARSSFLLKLAGIDND